MKVSIITVVFNNQDTIESAIESVLDQTYANIEYIVIDGASTDGTLELIKRYHERLAFVVSETDKGIYDAMNKGLALASGDVIGILNSDDFYLHSDIIADVVTTFTKNTAADLVLGNVDFVHGSDLSKPVRHYSSFRFEPWKMRFGFMPAHPGAFVKKTVYEEVGFYNVRYRISADFDMFVRMLIVKKMRFTKLNQTLVRMRIGGVSTSGFKSYWIITSEILKSLKENNINSNLFFVLIRLPVKFFQMIALKISRSGML